MEQDNSNTNKPMTLLDIAKENGRNINKEQLARIVDDARTAAETSMKKSENANYLTSDDWYHSPIIY